MEKPGPVLDVKNGWVQETVELAVEIGVLARGAGV